MSISGLQYTPALDLHRSRGGSQAAGLSVGAGRSLSRCENPPSLLDGQGLRRLRVHSSGK